MRCLRVGLWLTACSILAAPIIGESLPTESFTFLSKSLGFTSAELATVDAGAILVSLPKTAELREVAAVAIARIAVPPDFFLEKFRDIATFKKNKNVLQIGKFGNPPTLADLAGLTVDPADIESLKQCKVKSCDLKLSAKFIEKFRTEVDWTSPSYSDRATQFVHQMLLEQLQDYLKGGNAALVTYDDKTSALGLADEMRSLLKPTPYMLGYTPRFQKHLEEFPVTATVDATDFEDFVYWSKEEFGMKPVITITHVTIYRHGPAGSNVTIASKGIYASHYFESSLGLTSLVGKAGSSTRYVVYVNRSRTDALRGMFAGMKRSLIGGRLRDGAKKNMEIMRAKLEAQYAN
jgi:hypothetical protein